MNKYIRKLSYLSVFLIIGGFVAFNARANPSSENLQKPLSSYYQRIYSGLAQSYISDDSQVFENDYSSGLALNLTRINVGGAKMFTPVIIDRFTDAAYAPPSDRLPYFGPTSSLNGYNVISPAYIYYSQHIGRNNFLHQFDEDYPWLSKLLSLNKKAARVPGLNKWAGPILVSTGLPNDLVPENNTIDHSPFILPYDKTYPKKERIIAQTVGSLKGALSELTGLPVDFVEHENEGPQNYANLRIILTDEYGEKNVYRLTPSVSLERWHFRKSVETEFYTSVKFTPRMESGLDGYLIPDQNNVIQFAACYIWSGHTEKMIRALTTECLLRSMGLPGMAATSANAFLMLWNEKAETYKSRDDEEIPQALTPFDKLILRMLYENSLRAGSGPYAAKMYFETYFNKETENYLKGQK